MWQSTTAQLVPDLYVRQTPSVHILCQFSFSFSFNDPHNALAAAAAATCIAQVLLSKPVDKLRAELLVGFDPVGAFLSRCNERYGHIATFCADPAGGFGAVGIKWRPEAFVAGPLRPSHAHGMMEIRVTAGGFAGVGKQGLGTKQQKGGVGQGLQQHVGLVVPNVAQVLSEVAELGLGLVQRVVLLD